MGAKYATPNLSVGVEAALKRLPSACKRDGFELTAANLLVADTVDGSVQAIVWRDGAWHEVIDVDGAS